MRTSDLRVLALTHVFPRSETDAAAPFLLTWAHALRTAGAEVAVLAPHAADLPLRHAVSGVPVRRVRYAPTRWEVLAYRGEMHHVARTRAGPPLVAALLLALAAALRAETARTRPDVVHVHWWLPGMLIARLARPPAPVLCTLHGTDVALLESRPWLQPLARRALAGAARVEAVSADLAERARGMGVPVAAVNPMPLADAGEAGTDHPVVDRSEANVLRLLGVGRLVPEKGFDDLLRAAALLARRPTVTIIGDGPERAALRDLSRALGVELRLSGRVAPSELRAAYISADILVQASHSEGLGLVVAEALLAGLPVVAADSGGVRDLLPASALVPAGDHAALARRLEEVAGDLEQARVEVSELADGVRERLSPAAAARRTVMAYRHVTGSPATGRPVANHR